MIRADLEFVTAIDIGATRMRALLADLDERGQPRVLALAARPSAGVRRGALVDLPAAASCLRDLVHEVWQQADVDPHPVHVGVSGSNVRSLDSRSSVPLEGRGARVREDHVDALLERVRTIDVPFDRVILHCLPVEYSVDDCLGLSNPVGMVGTRLALDAHVITGEQSSVGAIQQCVAQADLDVASLQFAGCASAVAVTDDNEREGGCLVIDLGAETTNYALYQRGRVRRSGTVAAGAAHVTRDLAWGLSLDESVAERVKRRWATALRTQPVPRTTDGSESLPPNDVQARMGLIAESRQQEILELVAQDLQWGITRPALASGVVLTGGGSRLHGTEALAEQVFGARSSVRRPLPDDHGDQPDSWATTMGVAHLAVHERPALLTAEAAAGSGLWNNVHRWITRLV